LHRVKTVGFDPVTRFLGNEGGGDDLAHMAFFCQIALEPVPTGSGFIDKDQMLGFGVHLADEVVKVTVARADGPEGGDLGAMLFSDVGHRNGLFMDISSDVKRARLRHG
jgi:hypothetical protein